MFEYLSFKVFSMEKHRTVRSGERVGYELSLHQDTPENMYWCNENVRIPHYGLVIKFR